MEQQLELISSKELNLTQYYINRELSWLAFNERVLEEASDHRNPLFERIKFISIFCSNLDEFFMVRVAHVKDQIKEHITTPENKTGLSPKQQLKAIEQRTHELVTQLYNELMSSIFPSLKAEGIEFVPGSQIDANQAGFANTFFRERVFPVLTPMAIDSSRPFPMLMNKTLNLAVELIKEKEGSAENFFAVVQVPSLLPRFIPLPSQERQKKFILLEELLKLNISQLFPGYGIKSVHAFRITRDADLPLNEEEADDLLEEIEKELLMRRKGSAVRLEIDKATGSEVKEYLKWCLELEEEDVYSVTGPLDLTFFRYFAELPGYEHLRNEPLLPQPSCDLIGENNIFTAISKKDILLHHPYESFTPVIHFIRLAAEDPNVLAIKQTLYRVSGNSPIVAALAKAAMNGKQVMVLVELKARFDEENNIVWAKQLEEAGCHVIYGLVGLKTHGKITMVVRQEGDSIKRYVHLGTGNYNEKTARLYTDLGLFTCREEFGEDATFFFNFLSGYSDTPVFKQITIAPSQLKQRFLTLIKNEINKSTRDNPGHIIAKMNSLTDKDMIKALFSASQAGVQIDLIVRGICCLRPGIPGISENIRVISIVDRFLEHSRIYYFQNGGDEQIYFSSADWMTRNLEKRVEILVPLIEDRNKNRVKEILSILLNDNVKARQLQPDGTYQRVHAGNKQPLHSQIYLHEMTRHALKRKS